MVGWKPVEWRSGGDETILVHKIRVRRIFLDVGVKGYTARVLRLLSEPILGAVLPAAAGAKIAHGRHAAETKAPVAHALSTVVQVHFFAVNQVGRGWLRPRRAHVIILKEFLRNPPPKQDIRLEHETVRGVERVIEGRRGHEGVVIENREVVLAHAAELDTRPAIVRPLSTSSNASRPN